MLWILEHKHVWRVAELLLLLVALMGPWTFDLIFVPSEYTCSSPAVRLKVDYCGIPMSGLWILAWIVGGLINLIVEPITGTTVNTDKGLESLFRFLYPLSILLIVLPVFSTMLLVLRGDSQSRQLFQIAAWGLAASVSLILLLSGFSRGSWALWGAWLYIGLAASALVLEVGTMVAVRRLSQT